MDVVVNGEGQNLPQNCTVLELLLGRKLKPEGVVVELNREIVPAGEFAQTVLRSGDTVEILYFVGGG